ncbi:MAG: hypothetical protein QXW91_06015 [Candidatus Nitrosotenuis sp.]
MSGLGNLSQQSNHWRKPITGEQNESLVREFQTLLQVPRGGLLTANQRMRLLNLKKSFEGEDEKKLWFDIRHSVHVSFLDLALLSRVAQNSQLQAMLEPANDIYGLQNLAPDASYKNRLALLVGCLFFDGDLQPWKHRMTLELLELSARYAAMHPKFNTGLHQRIINDVLDMAKIRL